MGRIQHNYTNHKLTSYARYELYKQRFTHDGLQRETTDPPRLANVVSSKIQNHVRLRR